MAPSMIFPAFRNALFLMDPEKAHGLTITGLKAMPAIGSPISDDALRTTVAGLDFPNPVGLAAGFDKNAEVPLAILSLGFGFAEVGTITPKPQIGNDKPRLFRLTAEAERIHAEGHLKSLDGVASTAENLQAAIEGETHEFRTMYPPMVEHAQAENHKARRMFEYAVAAEEVHAKLYQKALEAVKQGKDLAADFYLCPVCGYIEMGLPQGPCPVCSTKPEKFVKAD